MTSIALPRIKVKKRKRRPPNPMEWIAILGFSAQAIILMLDIAMMTVAGPSMLIAAIIPIFFIWLYWPVVLNYIRNGFEDD